MFDFIYLFIFYSFLIIIFYFYESDDRRTAVLTPLFKERQVQQAFIKNKKKIPELQCCVKGGVTADITWLQKHREGVSNPSFLWSFEAS